MKSFTMSIYLSEDTFWFPCGSFFDVELMCGEWFTKFYRTVLLDGFESKIWGSTSDFRGPDEQILHCVITNIWQIKLHTWLWPEITVGPSSDLCISVC